MGQFTEEDIRKAIDYALMSYDEFDKCYNYDDEAREEGKEIILKEFLETLK